jgi:hypothetical protein
VSVVRVQSTNHRLGDITGDITALASLASSASASGGMTAWIQSQITQLNALPSVVSALQAIIDTLNASLTAVGLVPGNVPGFIQAQSDVTAISAGFPQAQSDLGVLGVTLYPALASGTFGLATITALSAQGIDVVGTFNAMQALFGYRDDAISQLGSVAKNPALPVATQQQIAQAIANVGTTSVKPGIGGYLAVGLGAFVLYKLARAIF